MPKLSYEGLVGTVMTLVVVVLDQAGVKNPYVLWIAFALSVVLCLDATIRSKWSKRKKAWVSCVIVLAFFLFALYLLRQLHPKAQARPLEQAPALGHTSTSETKEQPKRRTPSKSIAPCQITAKASSQIVSRVYSRGILPKVGEAAHYEPSFQQL